MKDQDQQSGDDSVNQQAGRDINTTMVYLGDPNPARAMEIARTVSQREIEKYHDAAAEKVEDRLREFREELIKRIDSLGPDRLTAFEDPDVQMTLREAHHSYARSGRADVRRSLIDLVAARCSASNDGFQAAVLSEAVEVVRKLSPSAIAILTLGFVLVRARGVGISSIDELVAWLKCNAWPFVESVPLEEHEYLFLEVTRTATIGITSIDLEEVVAVTYGGVLQRGLDREEISENIWNWHEENSESKLLVPCLNNPEKFQINSQDVNEVGSWAEISGLPIEDIKSAFRAGVRPRDEAIEKLAEKFDEWPVLIKKWLDSPLKNMRLTSTGIAIGHSNWSNATGGSAPLKIWLPDG